MSQPSQVFGCPYCGTQFYSQGGESIQCPGCAQVVVVAPAQSMFAAPLPPLAPRQFATSHADSAVPSFASEPTVRRKPKKTVLIGRKGAWYLGILGALIVGGCFAIYWMPSSPYLDLNPDHRLILERLRENAADDQYPIVIRWYPALKDDDLGVGGRRYRLKFKKQTPLGIVAFDKEYIVNDGQVSGGWDSR